MYPNLIYPLYELIQPLYESKSVREEASPDSFRHILRYAPNWFVFDNLYARASVVS
jgi:hypothetical protein